MHVVQTLFGVFGGLFGRAGARVMSSQVTLTSPSRHLLAELGPRPFTVSVEGNVGSGKSTFLRHFQGLEGVHTIEEPLEKWCDVNGYNLLEMLYKDPSRWCFLFQTYIQLTRLQMHLDRTPCQVKIIERSLQNNRFCFVESGRDLGSLTGAEYDVLDTYFRFLEAHADIGVDLVVYLRSTPERVYERVVRRARPEERPASLPLLLHLHSWHERWLTGPRSGHHRRPPVLVFNADQPLDQLVAEYDSNWDRISGASSCAAAT